MATETDFPARGKVIRVDGNKVVFAPAGTTYELLLVTATPFDGPVNTLIEGRIRIDARKLYTVASGGNFVDPIFGQPRIVQGRVKQVSDKSMVLHAGCDIVVNFPKEEHAIDLHTGGVRVNGLANVTVLPGSTFEYLGVAVLK